MKRFKRVGESTDPCGAPTTRNTRGRGCRFARLAAAAFLSAGVKVFLHGAICATPFVPFTVREKVGLAGL